MHTSGSTAQWLPCFQRSTPQSQQVSKGKEEERCLLRLSPSFVVIFSCNHIALTVRGYVCVYVYVNRAVILKLHAGLVQCRAESKADSAQQGEVNFPQRSNQGPVWTGRDFYLAAPLM